MKTNKKQKIYIFALILFISFFIFKTQYASATSTASVSFDIPATVEQGSNLDVLVNADTGGVLINSAELTVSYDADKLTFDGYSDTNSVIKLWISPPNANINSGIGQITFSGIIPGGVSGLYDAKVVGLAPIPLVHLLFTAKGAGVADFSFVDSKILEHDGLGTPLAHKELSTSVTIQNNPNYTGTQVNTVPTQPNNDINPVMPDSPDPLFWILVFVLVSGMLIYKLIKYKP